MKYFKSFSRLISTATASALLFGLMVVPAFAADLTFNNDPKDIFKIDEENSIDFQVGNLTQQNYQVGLTIKGPAGANSQEEAVDSQFMLGNTLANFTWNGEMGGNQADNGKYTATFSAPGLESLTHEFWVITAEPVISYTDADGPATFHAIADGEYSVSVDLSGYETDTTVKATMILEDNNLLIPQDEHVYKNNATHLFSWDVSDLDPGTYDVVILGEDSLDNPTNQLPYELTIVDAQSMLAFTSNPANTHEVDSGDYNVSVTLSDYTSDTLVTAHVVNPDNNLQIPVDNYTYTSAGTHVFNIPTDSYEVGSSHDLVIFGEDQDQVETNELTHTFTIVEAAATNCEGFADLPAPEDYKYCEAVGFVKKAGIMTGEGNGDFNAERPMIRATAGKIGLEAFGLYDESKDYCATLPASKSLFDITTKDAKWYNNYICRGLDIEMITGYQPPSPDAGYYRPIRDVSYAEGFKLILENVDANMPSENAATFSNFDTGKWYSSFSAFAYENNLVDDLTIKPGDPMTRIDMAVMLYRLSEMNYL